MGRKGDTTKFGSERKREIGSGRHKREKNGEERIQCQRERRPG